MSLEWDSERLAALIEKRRPLYDLRLKEHSNKQLVEQLWAEVAAEMGCTVMDCKTKWTSMRNSYARYLREMKHASSGGSIKRNWYLAHCMTFLKDFMGHHKRGPSVEVAIDDNSAESIEQEDRESIGNENLQYEDRRTRVSSTNSSQRGPEPTVRLVEDFETADVLFFRSLMADLRKLSERRKRKFKEVVMSSLHSLLDSEEDEEEASRRKASHSQSDL